MVNRIWTDEDGAVLSAELVLAGTVLVLGAVVGLSATAEGVVTELADLGGAIGALSQSYQVGGFKGHHALTGLSIFTDQHDFCDVPGDPTNAGNSRCLVICDGPTECDNDIVDG